MVSGTEVALREALERIQRQFEAVGTASQIEALRNGNVNEAAREIVELAANTAGCERVNAWRFNSDGTELHCIALYERSQRQHSSGAVLREEHFRDEFRALRSARYVDANDPLTDPRTAGYVEGYVKPLGITSMLDAVIHAGGRTLGLLCFEHVRQAHIWEQDEIAFACQLADKLGLAFLTQEQDLTREQVQSSEAALAEAQAIAHVGSWRYDILSGTLEWSAETYRIFGVERGAFTPSYDLVVRHIHPDDRARVEAIYGDVLSAGGDYISEHRIVKTDGSIRHVHERGRAFLDVAGRPVRSVGTVQDITARREAEARVLHNATHDELTGLANRRVFVDAVTASIQRAERHSRPFAVLSLDLDHFKDVNDTLGHPVGDELLRQVAARLCDVTRATDLVARFGGDEFAVIVSDLEHPSDAAVLAGALIRALAEPFLVDHSELRTGASIGIAVYSPEWSDAETLLSHADVALYRAKSEGRGEYRFFTQAMDTAVRSRVALRAELREAMETGQFFLVYQPQVDLTSGRITGVEALVRWHHPARGVLLPDGFVPAAEECGLIVPLSQWVLGEACRQMRAWLDAGLEPGSVAVNLSATHFKSGYGLELDVTTVLERTRLPTGLLELEVTETVLMAASREHGDVLGRLRASGVRLSLDDFGTGYSSLDYLRRFPVDRIKIAQDFVSQLASEGSAVIVKATIGLARELGIAVIAEGVDSVNQLETLQRLGCREAQGFLFARPMPPGNIEPLLRAGRLALPLPALAQAFAG